MRGSSPVVVAAAFLARHPESGVVIHLSQQLPKGLPRAALLQKAVGDLVLGITNCTARDSNSLM